MNTKQLNIFKTILFIAGLALIATAFFIVNFPFQESGLLANQIFFWINIALMYLVFFCPFFFSTISSKTIDTKITSTIGTWISVIIFEIVALIFSILVLNKVATIKLAIIIELVLIFLCAIFIYFGYFAGNHIANVQLVEQESLNKIAELKNAFEMLNFKAQTWSNSLSEQKSKLKKLCDDVKYISPVSTDAAAKLEQKLIIAANVLAESNLLPEEADQKIADMEFLLKQRKLMRK